MTQSVNLNYLCDINALNNFANSEYICTPCKEFLVEKWL